MIKWSSLFKSAYEKQCRDLYNRFARQMLNVSYRIVGSQTEAEDILQEAFIAAFTKKELLGRDDEFGRWLKKIIVNRSIDYLRKRSISFELVDDLHSLHEDDTHIAPDVEGYTVEDVKLALAGLPEGYRLVLTLYLFEDYTHAEIAAALGISMGTSKSQFNRGRKKLAAILMHKNTMHETR
jgi:RNA polymerase sigma-70 factor (ECF subfamily)